jgi:hypothetical protein
MAKNLIPIQTSYKGYRFRSRLEARWAVFFDSLGVKYEYEPDAFQTSLGGYLPDFYLPYIAGGVFVEVKPAGGFSDDAIQKCYELSIGTRTPCVLADGSPDDVCYLILDPSHSRGWFFELAPCDVAIMGVFCADRLSKDKTFEELDYWCVMESGDRRTILQETPAVLAARGYRF